MESTVIQKYTVKLVKEKSVKYGDPVVRSSDDAQAIMRKLFKPDELTQEQLMMMTLDTKNNVTGAFIVSIGSLNSSIVHPRDVYSRALASNAAAILICHNHPSGDPSPSSDDCNVTERLKNAGEILGIELLDHIIVGAHTNRYYSFREEGRI